MELRVQTDNRSGHNSAASRYDSVTLFESPFQPGAVVCMRSAEERQTRPDRLNLDRRQLTACPVVEGEPTLKLLNLQHNRITAIGNLAVFRCLIFLDLYDNQIETISGLEAIPTLRVLMLGRNRIQKIENLEAVPHLDVLDLHGNRIEEATGLQVLQELRVLNLASNAIVRIDDITGLPALMELNLRRNKISFACTSLHLPSLERLYLSFNEIHHCSDVAAIAALPSISELALDGNLVTREGGYKEYFIESLRGLRLLDGRRITDEERRMAASILRREDEKRREMERTLQQKVEKAQAIEAAQKRWQEVLSTLQPRSTPFPNTARPQSAVLPSQAAALVRRVSAGPLGRGPVARVPALRPVQPGQYFVELDGDTLHIYGEGLDSLDRAWAQQITTVCFHFVLFDMVAPHLPRLRARFPALHTLVLADTHLYSLGQINHIAVLKKLEHLNISESQPLLLSLRVWRQYTIFLLPHLKTINGAPVTLAEQKEAASIFGSLEAITEKYSSRKTPAFSPAPAPPQAEVKDVRRRNPLDAKRSLDDLKSSPGGAASSPTSALRSEGSRSRARLPSSPSSPSSGLGLVDAYVQSVIAAAEQRWDLARRVDEVWDSVVDAALLQALQADTAS